MVVQSIRQQRKGLYHNIKKYGYYYALLIPAIVWFFVFCYLPMYGVVIAFKNYRMADGIMGSAWVGVKHFEVLFKQPKFLQVMRNTINISVLRLLFGFPAPILLALLLNEVRSSRYLRVVQSISYLPHFMSWVVLGGIFTTLLSPGTGAVNQLIKAVGGQPVYFLADAAVFVPTLIVTGIWAGIGWGSILYLATISGIDPQMYEAAIVEGANRMQQCLYITLPSLAGIIGLQLILAVSGILNAGFDQVFNMYNPTVYSVADILDTYTYRLGLLDMNYSRSAAIGLFKNVIGFVMLISVNAIVKRLNDGIGIW